jgi:hypothetical protein
VIILAILGIGAFFKWRAKEKQRKERQKQKAYPPEYDEIYGTTPLRPIPSAPIVTASNLSLFK